MIYYSPSWKTSMHFCNSFFYSTCKPWNWITASVSCHSKAGFNKFSWPLLQLQSWGKDCLFWCEIISPCLECSYTQYIILFQFFVPLFCLKMKFLCKRNMKIECHENWDEFWDDVCFPQKWERIISVACCNFLWYGSEETKFKGVIL